MQSAFPSLNSNPAFGPHCMRCLETPFLGMAVKWLSQPNGAWLFQTSSRFLILFVCLFAFYAAVSGAEALLMLASNCNHHLLHLGQHKRCRMASEPLGCFLAPKCHRCEAFLIGIRDKWEDVAPRCPASTCARFLRSCELDLWLSPRRECACLKRCHHPPPWLMASLLSSPGVSRCGPGITEGENRCP